MKFQCFAKDLPKVDTQKSMYNAQGLCVPYIENSLPTYICWFKKLFVTWQQIWNPLGNHLSSFSSQHSTNYPAIRQ